VNDSLNNERSKLSNLKVADWYFRVSMAIIVISYLTGGPIAMLWVLLIALWVGALTVISVKRLLKSP
jgi:hypothetical protein